MYFFLGYDLFSYQRLSYATQEGTRERAPNATT